MFTDGRTDGQKEKSITIYLASSFHSLGGYNYLAKSITINNVLPGNKKTYTTRTVGLCSMAYHEGKLNNIFNILNGAEICIKNQSEVRMAII